MLKKPFTIHSVFQNMPAARNLCTYDKVMAKVHTHSSEHTHTVNTHLEQWIALYAAAPGDQLGVWCLAQGHLSCGIVVLGVERALYIHSPHLPFLPA